MTRTEAASPRNGAALVVERLAVTLGDVNILHDLSFRVNRGTSVVVIGPNGSGKTVLFRALVGAIPHRGVIRWMEGARLGYVPQKLDLERNLPVTGRDVLSAQLRLRRGSSQQLDAALSRVGLNDVALDRLVGTLSGGQLQRLLIAFALLGNPNVLLLDEPTAGVDEPGQERLHDLLRGLRDDGVTILTISHDLSVVSRSATEVLCITRDHRCFGIPRRALSPAILADIYGEPVDFFRHDDARD